MDIESLGTQQLKTNPGRTFTYMARNLVHDMFELLREPFEAIELESELLVDMASLHDSAANSNEQRAQKWR